MDGASRGLAFGPDLRKTRLRWASSVSYKQQSRACSCFDDRHNVSSKERSAGTQAVACQALWVIYDRCYTWIRTVCAARSSAMAGKARRPRTADKVHCLQADEREASALHPPNQENVARRRFIHASRARQQEYRKLAARRFQNRDRQAAPKTMGPPRGPIFVTVQSKTQPDKCSPRFLLHILERECLLRL